jgi:hypothetical protein
MLLADRAMSARVPYSVRIHVGCGVTPYCTTSRHVASRHVALQRHCVCVYGQTFSWQCSIKNVMLNGRFQNMSVTPSGVRDGA